MANKPELILTLSRQKLMVAGALLPAPLTLEFPNKIVADIDIVDPESFDRLVDNFFEQSKIDPSDVVLLLTEDVYYENSLTLPVDPIEREKEVGLLLSTIPFKEVVYKDYSQGESSRIITINKNFYEPLIKNIEKKGFDVRAIIPTFILEQLSLPLTEYLPKEIKEIFKKSKQLESLSLVSSQDIDRMVSPVINKPKEDHKRTYLLLIIFCILFVVLLGYIFIQPKLTKPPAPTPALTKALITTAPATETSTTSPTPTISYISTEDIKVKIINSSGVPNQAAKIKNIITPLGVKQIETTSSSVITAAKNQISFSPNISPDIRQKVTEYVESIAGQVTILELKDLSGFDILITTTLKPV